MEIKNKIIFDNVVLYDRAAAKLMNISDPENIATLTVPANECLAIIIDNSPGVTTQKQLFNDVWEAHGIPINSNTFYQNISILRKAFKQVGIDYDVIVTIPRRGIELSKNIKITIHSGQCINEGNGNFDTEKVGDATTGITNGAANESIRNLKSKKRYVGFSLLSFSFIFLIYFLYSYYIQTNSPFCNYSFIKEYNGCYIYVNENYSHQYADEIIKTSNLEQCHNREYVYFSVIPKLPRISMIICDEKIYEKNSICRSAYYYLSGE
mgnify:CR=1 FL=1